VDELELLVGHGLGPRLGVISHSEGSLSSFNASSTTFRITLCALEEQPMPQLPTEIVAPNDHRDAPHRALWHGPWGTLLLFGDPWTIARAVFQGPLPEIPMSPMPLPPPWGNRARVRLALRGTAFQLAVWRALGELRCDERVTYGRLAARIGRPAAVRAVANAVAANPVPVVLPCHRVIRRDGRIGRYSGGTERKIRLLQTERIHRSDPHHVQDRADGHS
jgi:O-6-methylguanine DNA methyltransferase